MSLDRLLGWTVEAFSHEAVEHRLLLYSQKCPHASPKYQETPLLLAPILKIPFFFIRSRFSVPQKPFPSIVSTSPTLCPQLLSLLFYVKFLSLWTLTPAWMCSPRAPRHGVGFQLSGPKGGFPFQNVWLVNVSPGWKPIPWKTGGMFFQTRHRSVCVCVRDLFLPLTHS